MVLMRCASSCTGIHCCFCCRDMLTRLSLGPVLRQVTQDAERPQLLLLNKLLQTLAQTPGLWKGSG